MNTKSLALIMGIIAAAATQIGNVLSGQCDGKCPDDCDKENSKPSKPAKGTKPKKDEPEEDAFVADDPGDDEDLDIADVDYDEIRRKNKKAVSALIAEDADNKPKIGKFLKKLGESNVGDMSDENAVKFAAGLKKLA